MPMMHGHEKSDSAIVATKPPNKAGRPAAEAVERRAEAGLWRSAHDLRYTGRTVFRGSAGDLRPLGHDATKSENLAASFRGLLVLHEITYG